MDGEKDDIYEEKLDVQKLLNLDMMEEWDRLCQMCVVDLVHYLVSLALLLQVHIDSVPKPISSGMHTRDYMRKQLMQNLMDEDKCRNVIRMSPHAFLRLCEKLKSTGRVRDSRYSTVEEQVAKFLHILAHNVKNRTVSFFFHRSGETIHRHFHSVLRAIISLEDELIVQPSGLEVPTQILNNSRFFPYFKDCVGALDGTHMRVKVPRKDAPRFRGRKDFPTQNVLAVCSFDMKFTYVLAGWEGTASDSRVLKHALRKRGDRLQIQRGKFYLGDAGFPLKGGLLTPYRGVRYHLKEYTTRGPQTAKEIFNHRHASLRNVIERAFGVLKKRFPIIATGTEPYYSFTTMTDITVACCVLHNFLMDVDPDHRLIAEVDREILHNDTDEDGDQDTRNTEEDYRQGLVLRDSIAAQMWNDYQESVP